MTIAKSNDIRAYPVPEIVADMEQQEDLVETAKPLLIEQFSGRYVWFKNGQVLDSDANHEVLVLRIYGDGEPRPLFIRKVTISEPKLLVRSAPHEVGIRFDRYRHFVFRVYGCSVDDMGKMTLVGRDILNLYKVEFDDPNGVFAVY